MHTYIIAEAGVNHNGWLEVATQLVDVAAEAGADAVKFQTFRAGALATKTAHKAAYQRETTDAEESQLDMLRSLELRPEHHTSLLAHCSERGIQFLSTPFDLESADLLIDVLDLPRIKLPSGDLTNAPLLLHVARTGRPVMLSTGMSTLADVEGALGVLAFGYIDEGEGEEPSREAFRRAYASSAGQARLQENVTLLHCTTAYPAPFEEVNLRAMDTLKAAFGLPVGLSDHTPGIAVPVAAVARGAALVEKHFTLDRAMPGPDHRASLEPDELAAMIRSIRQVEEALGTARKAPTASELKNRSVARKSLVAARPVRAGEPFTEENLTVKRPGQGVSPMRYWDLLSRHASHDYDQDDLIDE